MKNEIGGYFQLELNKDREYHDKAIALNTGRNALEYILRAKIFKKIYLPFYTCDVLLEPLKKTKTDYEFYHFNENFEPSIKSIKSNEVFLTINYFGILDVKVKEITNQYQNIIVDNSQAFYAKPINDIDTFFSCRKFFGVPDGAYLYTNNELKGNLPTDVSYDRMGHLLIRKDINATKGYFQFIKNEKLLRNQPIKKMSIITSSLLHSIDYKKIKKIRRKNFLFLHQKLGNSNQLNISLSNDSVPMVYPYLVKNGYKVKEKLISKNIYIATYWSNVFEWTKKNNWEYYLSKNLVPLPIDQRYSIMDMNKIVKEIENSIQ